MNMNDPNQPPVPMLHQPKPTTPTATAFSDMWIGDGYSAEAAFDTLFEPLRFHAGYGVEGAGGAAGYEYTEGMGMVG